MMKKICAALAAFALCVGVLAGCAGQAQQQQTASSQSNAPEKIQVVCATFPAYDWVKQVVGDQADRYDIAYLMGNGTDLHSYQPTVEDVAKIADCDLFVYVGGESDGWAEDALVAAGNADIHSVSMLEAVGDAAVEEEIVEGMEAEAHDHESEGAEAHESEEAHEHESEEAHEHEDGEELEYDEHVWLSLRNAQVLVDAIAGELAAIDPDSAESYMANAKAYNVQLAELDKKYEEAVKSAPHDTVVFADRFPFRYLVDDYGIPYYAAFVGCSAETEASFETIAFLAKKVDELGLGTVLVIEGSDQEIAKTVIQNTQKKDQKILVMDSLQSTLDSDVQAGKTYLGTMEDNLGVLAEALG